MGIYDDEEQEAQRLRDISGVGEDGQLAGGDHDAAGKHRDGGARHAAKSTPLSKSELGDAEKDTDQFGDGFNPDDRSFSNRARMAKFFGGKKGRRLLVGGGISGLVIGGGLGILSLISGPLEFVHISQLLQQFHFSSQEDASDDRFSRIVRYIRDPANPQRTRLGILGNHYADAFEKRMNEGGIKSAYTDTFGYFDGYIVDPQKVVLGDKAGPLSAQQSLDVQKQFAKDYGIQLEPGEKYNPKLKGKFVVKASKLGYFKQRTLVRQQLKAAGYTKITGAIAARIMGKRAGVDWHPIKRLDNKIKQSAVDKLKEWKKDHAADIDHGVEAEEIVRTEDLQKDPNGNVDPAQQASADQLASEADKIASDGQSAGQAAAGGDSEAVSKYATSLKIGGIGAAGLGSLVAIACMAEALNANIDSIKQAQVVDPSIRSGVDMMATGAQVQDGPADLDPDQLSYASASFQGKDSTGQVSSWSDARSFQSHLGQPQSGPPAPSALDIFTTGSPFAFLSGITGLDSVCKAVNSPVGQVVQVGVSFLGGPIGAIAGTIGAAFAGPYIFNTVAQWFAGKPISAFPVGADAGYIWDTGAALGANDQAIAAGGGALSAAQSAELNQMEQADSQQQFKSQSVAYRLFNPYDARTLVSKVIDKTSPSATQNVASLAQGFTHLGSVLASLPRSLAFSGQASAAATPYNYGFPDYGFSKTELNDSSVGNPFQNAQRASDLLDGANGPSLIQKANDCFGVTVANDTGAWDVTGGASTTQAYSADYKAKDCNEHTKEWLTIRFFIFDTETMNAAACYNGDDQACQDSGFGDDAAGTASTDVSTIDQKTLFQDSSDIPCAAGTKDLGIQDGWHNGQKFPIRICAVTNLLSTSGESHDKYGVTGANGYAVVNSRVSANVYQMVAAAAKDNVRLKADSSFRTYAHQQALCPCDGILKARPGFSNHQAGVAIDFIGPGKSGGDATCRTRATDPGDPSWVWLNDHAASYGFRQYAYESWHWDALNDAGSRCGGDGST